MSDHSKVVAFTGRPKPPAAGKGRPKGKPNKTTALLKDAIIKAADAEGENGKGKGGLTGYLCFLARKHPASFAVLLGKVLPTQITGNDGGPVEVLTKEARDAAVVAALRAGS
ncbi:MAG: hypothetical protein BGN85_09435 [Alphaproteobacteria bacterium 64-11]|nr:MAG: hypothetical protein BGN85_09435 [Alphaproteobacteria bacterium 64-11]